MRAQFKRPFNSRGGPLTPKNTLHHLLGEKGKDGCGGTLRGEDKESYMDNKKSWRLSCRMTTSGVLKQRREEEKTKNDAHCILLVHRQSTRLLYSSFFIFSCSPISYFFVCFTL